MLLKYTYNVFKSNFNINYEWDFRVILSGLSGFQKRFHPNARNDDLLLLEKS